MVVDVIPLTKAGYEELRDELENLKKVERPAVIEAIAEAREHGDLKENAEYHAAREKQGLIEARIQDLDAKLSRAEIVNPGSKGDTDQVSFGARVVLCDEDTEEEKEYLLVGDLEANISRNKISISSPMGRALLGRKVDDLISIRAPKGNKEYVILSITY